MLASAEGSTALFEANSASDEILVACFQAGNNVAFDVLAQRHTHALYKFSVSLVGKDQADDLVQDTFLRAYQKLPCLQKPLRSFKAWLYQIAKNLATDQWRHARLISWLPWKEQDVTIGDRHPFVIRIEEEIEEADFIDRILAHVSAKYSPCLYLDIFEDMRQREIALLLGLPERTVRRYIFEGKKQLCEIYEHLKNQRDI